MISIYLSLYIYIHNYIYTCIYDTFRISGIQVAVQTIWPSTEAGMDFAGVYGVSGQRFCEKARMSCRNSYNLEYGSAFQHQTFVVRDICCKSCSEADSGDGDQL